MSASPEIIYIAVYREEQPSAAYKTFTSLDGLVRFEESWSEVYGPYDAFVVNLQECSIVPYDMNLIRKLVRQGKKVVDRKGR